MADWQTNLSEALASGDPLFMQARLAEVPPESLKVVAPWLARMARDSAQQGRLALARMYYDQLIAAEPANRTWQDEQASVLAQMAPPEAQPEPAPAASSGTAPGAGVAAAGTRGGFDPALLANPALDGFDALRVEGIVQHLRRHSAQVSPRKAMARLADPQWLAAWDLALADTRGERVLLHGSELGIFALRALQHGAVHAVCAEQCALDARIAGGIAHKHFLARWHAEHGLALASAAEADKRASFDAFAAAIDIIGPDSGSAPAAQCLVLPQIDHTLLGTGLVKAVRQYGAIHGAPPARVLPARATVYAMAIGWHYPGAPADFSPLDRLRWSMAAQPLELDSQFWHARTEAVCCGSIDFATFDETEWELSLPVTAAGQVDAVVYWFELELGPARISNAPGSGLQCIKPAVQYLDPFLVQDGACLALRVLVEETRLHFVPPAAPAQVRHASLPGWYVPMLGDQVRNGAYDAALGAALAGRAGTLALEIGAGCGVLSLLAVRNGADRVLACESNPALAETGRAIIDGAGLAKRITLLTGDCRQLRGGDMLPERAAMALFERFDCSLIGEGILHFLTHARAHLLSSDACYLPASATIRAMVVEYRIEQLWGIDAGLLNPFRSTPAVCNVDASTLPHRVLSEPFDVFTFDFATATAAPDERALQPLMQAGGTAGAVLFWFDLRLDATRTISNDPRLGSGAHWKQGLKILPEVRVDAGATLPLVARHDGSALDFHWNVELLPRAGLSPVPRCDPRWLAASAELEQQTGGLLEHCARAPGERAQVAAIAQRLAVDPGRHGLDWAIAQRFASLFLEQEQEREQAQGQEREQEREQEQGGAA